MNGPRIRPTARLTLDGARDLTDAALAAARDLGVEVVIAVVDPAGVTLSVQRMDGAPAFSLTVATKKAWTAAAARTRTSSLAAAFLPSPTLLHALTPAVDELLPVGGGTPVIVDGQLVGAVAISGATEEQDQQIADTAVATVFPTSP